MMTVSGIYIIVKTVHSKTRWRCKYFLLTLLFGRSTGLLVVNLVCRDEDLKQRTVKDIKDVFRSTFVKAVDDEVNDIVFCLKEKVDNPMEILETAKKELHSVNVRLRKNLGNEDLVDITSLMQTIKII